MQFRFFFGMIATVLCAACLWSPSTAQAKDGRDFAGFYRMTNVVEKDGEVKLTIHLQLFNYGDADLGEAVVDLYSSHPGGDAIGRFSLVQSWRKGQEAGVTGEFTVPAEEYQRWTSHEQPAIFVTYSDSDGQTWQFPAQVSQDLRTR